MKKLLSGLAIASFLLIPGTAKAQNYEYCTHDNGDRYYTGIFYEYGHGYPVVLDDVEDVLSVPSYMTFTGRVTMYSFTEDRQILMTNGEYVEIFGMWFESDCYMQLLVYSPRLGLAGSVPADTVAVPQ